MARNTLALAVLAGIAAQLDTLKTALEQEDGISPGLPAQPQAGTPIDATAGANAQSAPQWTKGMSQPDRYGRVMLEEVEAFRSQRGQEFEALNRPIPKWYFVADAGNTFPLNAFQRHHLNHNIGDNANAGFAGRWGSAVKFEQREDGSLVELGRFTSTDPDGDTLAVKARHAPQAAQEVIQRLSEQLEYEQQHGTTNNPEFAPRQNINQQKVDAATNKSRG